MDGNFIPKPILSIDDQILHMQNKGITFEKCTVDEAKQYLINNNNFFKLYSYRKNFNKIDDKYQDLDFAMLKDFAIIDMRLRYLIVHMVLDLEHFAKVKLVNCIQKCSMDGYQIVDSYKESLPEEQLAKLDNAISRNKKSIYCGDLINAYQERMPVWVFVEVVSFGDFISFYRFAAYQMDVLFPSKAHKRMQEDYFRFLAIKNLRNAAAHSNCILNNLSAKHNSHTTNYDVLRSLPNTLISKSKRDIKVKNECFRELVTLLYQYKEIVTSEGVVNDRTNDLHEFIKRMYKHIDYYENNSTILSCFDFLKKVVDNYYPL